MPEIKQLQKHFRNNDDFAMLTVSIDDLATTPDLRQVIRKHRIRYPVLNVGADDGWVDGSFDWTLSGVPVAYIIDPQGNIFASVYPRAELIEVFEALMAQDSAPLAVGLGVATELQDDGSVNVSLQLASPTHAPLDVGVSVTKMVLGYNPDYDTDGTGEPNGFESTDLDDLKLSFTQEFEMFGEATHTFTIPAQEDAYGIVIDVSAQVPGMEEFDAGQGYSVRTREMVRVNEETE